MSKQIYDLNVVKMKKDPNLMEPPAIVRIMVDKKWLKCAKAAQKSQSQFFIIEDEPEVPYMVAKISKSNRRGYWNIWFSFVASTP